MYSFMNDYSEGAYPPILTRLSQINSTQLDGYGLDEISDSAREKIWRELGDRSASIHFIHGGTATNLTVIAACLRPYEAVISPHSGHICTHEAGAIEACGHKAIHVPCSDGKMTVEMIENTVKQHTDEHMVYPKLVYISNPTEIGTIYNKKELEDLRSCCDRHGLLLYLDGARIGMALTAKGQDLKMSDLPGLCDVFYIGGTKNGAMIGEAVVISNPEIDRNFRFVMKQKGALMAKGWMIGVQFECLLDDGAYYRLANHANNSAQHIKEELEKMGVEFFADSPTNQIFPILSYEAVEKLQENFKFHTWEDMGDGMMSIRIVASWATPMEMADYFISQVKNLVK